MTPFLANAALFVLATFLGVELIGRVPPTLHTPLMSAANAVSGISICGAIAIAGSGHGALSQWLGFFATAFAMINVVGIEFLANLGGLGYLVGEMYDRYEIPDMYAAIVCVILTSALLYALSGRVERWLGAR